MVMGQEERKNKAKLEKTQISLASSNTEYENAIKALEDTTARWNREWKSAADKFQDLEEERLDFTKSSLWTFANIASTVCVSDDASCEKIRLSLEKMDVEQDITTFITERGTGQEIPDPPKYINFCRGDVNDTPSEVSEDDNYSVAQFPRSINPAFRTSSPQPSVFESHHDPSSALAYDMGLGNVNPSGREVAAPQKAATPKKASMSMENDGQRQLEMRPERQIERQPERQIERQPDRARQEVFHAPSQTRPHGLDLSQYGQVSAVPHDPYPTDGMTMLCRPPGTSSDLSSSARPSSRDSRSEISIATSFTSQDPPSGKVSPTKQDLVPAASPEKEKRMLKKRSGFFQNHSPFRRKSVKEVQAPPSNRNTWHSSNNQASQQAPPRRQPPYQHEQIGAPQNRAASPDPIDANASVALGVGGNVLPVSAPDSSRAVAMKKPQNGQDDDPIAQALAELKGVASGKSSSVRVSADSYHGIATPAPGMKGRMANSAAAAGMAGTPPPSYDQQVQRLGVPPSAHTAKAMKQTSEKFVGQTRNMFGGSGGYGPQGVPRPNARGNEVPRAASPAPPRSASPLPAGSQDSYRNSYRAPSPNPSRAGSQDAYSRSYRSASPNPATPGQRAPSQMTMDQRPSGQYSGHNSPIDYRRSASPAPYADYGRPSSSHTANEMAVQLAPASDDGYGSQRGRYGGRPGTSSSSRAVGLYEPPGAVQASRPRSKSVADPSRQYTRDGRPVIHYGKSFRSRVFSTNMACG